MDFVGTLGAAVYGVFMGSYPVPIKAPRVRAANVHPIVFQCYKSFWVMVSGLLFAIPVYARGERLHLTWWAFASAACWVPSGTCTIASVMLNGVSLSIVLNAASGAIASFLVFWLVLNEPVKKHNIGGHEVYLAPFYLAGCVLGMVALVYGPFLPGRLRRSKETTPREALLADGAAAGAAKRAPGSLARFVAGVLLAILAGLLGGGQYAAVTIGRSFEERRAGCEHNTTLCPAALKQSFDPLGSWSFMFGLGAASVTLVLLLLLCVFRLVLGRAPPSLELSVLRVPGSLAGILWVIGNLGGELSVLHGGNSVEVPTMVSIQLIVSGAWGIVYYGEVKGRAEVGIWVAAAVWTLAMVLLLGMEKAK